MVAGIGNIFLGDDGFGPEVTRQVGPCLTDEAAVRVVDYGIRGVHLAYDLLDGVDGLVLIDALPDRGIPGELRVFEADRVAPAHTVGLDAHSMDPGAVFASLRALGADPPPTIVVGCQVQSIADGIGLSEPVAAAVGPAVVATIDAVALLRTRHGALSGEAR